MKSLFTQARALSDRLSSSRSSGKDSWSPLHPNPDFSFPNFPPPIPTEIIANHAYYTDAVLQRKYLAPPGQDDCSLFSLYRIYENVMLDRNIGLRNEIEYFWNKHSWSVFEIPDPKDPDPERYAVLACIPLMLTIAFNNNINRSLPRDAPAIMTYEEIDEFQNREKQWEKVPEWTSSVPRLEHTLKIPHWNDTNDGGNDLAVLDRNDDPKASAIFLEKNILILEPHFLFT